MPRKKQVSVDVEVERRVSKRAHKPRNDLEYVYESPTPKKRAKSVHEKPIQKQQNSVDKNKQLAEDVDPLLEPFKFGWKRELVNPGDDDENNIEVYYYNPKGKKLSTFADIMSNLTNRLSLKNFTYMKKSITNNREHEIETFSKRKAAGAKKELTKKAKNDGPSDSEPAVQSKTVAKIVEKPQEPVTIQKVNQETKPDKNLPAKKSRKASAHSKKQEPEAVAKTPLPSLAEERPKRVRTPKFPKGYSPPPQTSAEATTTSVSVPNSSKDAEKSTEPAKVSQFQKNLNEAMMKEQKKQKEVPIESEKGMKAKEPVAANETKTKKDPKPKETIDKGRNDDVEDQIRGQEIKTNNQISKRTRKQSTAVVSNGGAPSNVAVRRTKKVDPVPEKAEKQLPVNKKQKEAPKAPNKVPISAPAGKKEKEVSVVDGKQDAAKNHVVQSPVEYVSTKANVFGDSAACYTALLKVFGCLNVIDLLKVSSVCQQWYQISRNDSLWKQLHLKNKIISEVDVFLKFLHNRKITSLKLEDVRMDHFSERIPKLSASIEKLEISGVKNKVCEILLKQNLTDLMDLKLQNISGEIDFSQVGNLANLVTLELASPIEFASTTFPTEKFNTIRTLSISKITSHNVYEEMSKLSQNLDELILDTVHNRQLISTFLLSFVNLSSLQLKNIDSYANDLLQTVKTMRNLQKLSLINFQVKVNFDLYLSQCANLTDLEVQPDLNGIGTKHQNINFIIVSGMLKLKLNSFKWIICSAQKSDYKIQFSRSTISDNLSEISRQLFTLVDAQNGGRICFTDDEKLDETRKLFEFEENGKDDIAIEYQTFQTNLRKLLKKTVIEISLA